MFMTQIPFITYREQLEDNVIGYFILQKDYPHFVGIISSTPYHKLVSSVAIAGYNLWVAFYGTLRGNVIPSYEGVGDEINEVLHRMAIWFLENRINNAERKYTKFKINVSTDNNQ